MPSPYSITSVNASLSLTIPGVYSSGVLLQNFSTDDMFDPDPQTLTESRVGADGFFVGGYVFNPSKIRMMFQGNSSSIPVFYQWKAAQDAVRDIIVGSMKIISPALGMDVDLEEVHFTSVAFLPPHKRVVDPLTIELTTGPGWQTTQT